MSYLPRAQWSSYSSYVLVTTGSIVGLGNIFNFPFLVAKYGGIFVLFYILSSLFIAIPAMFAELLIGRRGKQNPVGAISIVAMESKATRYWRLIGWLCFVILFLTLSYYTVAVSMPLSYLIDNIGMLVNHRSTQFNTTDYVSISSHFFLLEICFLVFLLITMAVIVRGINRGLEGISWITVPTYFIILFLLVVYSAIYGDFWGAIKYVFQAPSEQPILPIAFAALMYAFFTLNIGMGSLMVYGSYLPYDVPLAQSTIIIVCLDALAAFLAYFTIFPLMLQSHSISQTETLSYQNIMTLFTGVPYGTVIATLFFLAAVIAAWTPTIAMAESATLTLIERFGISRLKGSILIAIGAIIVGTIVVLSYTKWPDVHMFSQWTIAGFIQNFASDIATPISAFLIAIFTGWVVKRSITESELEFYPFVYQLWRFSIRYLAPMVILIILLLVGFS